MRLAQKGDEAVMEVIDSGPGISAAERERVFDAFYRIPDSPGDGRGLGFAMAREAAPAWAARLALRVLQGRGGCVQVIKVGKAGLAGHG
ncbi:MAG: ATP-binding protein [Thiobacillaceae bacterium]